MKIHQPCHLVQAQQQMKLIYMKDKTNYMLLNELFNPFKTYQFN
jgi:hypothetical protein